MGAGNRLGDVGNAVQSWVRERIFGGAGILWVMAWEPKCMERANCRITVMWTRRAAAGSMS